MENQKSTLRICVKGHTFYKSSDCPTCPICEEERKPKDGFLALLSAPARRALENQNISSLNELTEYSEKDLLKLHGMGKSSIPVLRQTLDEKGLSFKE